MQQIKLLNKSIYTFKDRNELLDYISDKKKILIAMNAEKIIKDDLRLTAIINSNIGYPDGIGVVWALRKKGFYVEKIAGVELWLEIIKKFKSNKNFYLIGSTGTVINKTVKKLKKDFPGINILNFSNGFLNNSEKGHLIKDVSEKKPDVVFIAMGTPKQEYFMEELFSIHPALFMGLGGSFDVYCGVMKRAPKILIKFNVEWLYRLLREPSRIVRQMYLIKFIFFLFRNKI